MPTAVLSRGLAGVAGRTLVVNLPGSTGGVSDGLVVLDRVLDHALDQISGGDHQSASHHQQRLGHQPASGAPQTSGRDRADLQSVSGGELEERHPHSEHPFLSGHRHVDGDRGSASSDGGGGAER